MGNIVPHIFLTRQCRDWLAVALDLSQASARRQLGEDDIFAQRRGQYPCATVQTDGAARVYGLDDIVDLERRFGGGSRRHCRRRGGRHGGVREP